ncbi:MAG: efflux RND transporter periplasmic adaptor subunit [Deltaproteobacteria bacterium]|nr:efflux RND transporter periplasmic adaptor subunit [Deltaproteobacteria bacterium]
MKRVIGAFVVLTLVLSGVLYWRLQLQAEEAARPPGSSGIVEQTRVTLAARLSARLAAVHVREGERVETGALLAELDCAEPDALVAEAEARLAAARIQVEPLRNQAAAAAAQAEAVRRTAEAATAQAEAAKQQISAARRQAAAARRTVGAVRAQRDNADRQRDRAEALLAEAVVRPVDLEGSDTAAADLSYRVDAASATAGAASASAAAAESQARAAEQQAAAAGQQVVAAGEQAKAAGEQVRAAEAQLIVAEVTVRRARIAQAECRIVAPRAGIVTLVAREVGEAVLPGTTLFELTDPAETTVTFYVVNADLGRVRPGQRVRVVADALPGRAGTGTIRWIAREAEFTPRTVQTRDDRDRLVYAVEALVENPDGALRDGMPVEVVVEVPR